MNFLAHLYLSCNNEDLTMGNFLADFIRNRDVPTFSEEVQAGIRLHRKIDAYTDNHAIVRQGTKRLRSNHGKYAPVVIDVFYDYLLANNWGRYSEEPLRAFTGRMYKILIKRMALMPLSLQARLPMMVADDWLMKYGVEKGLRRTFKRLQKRTSRPLLLENAVDHLLENVEAFEAEFNLFFPEVIKYVEGECLVVLKREE